MKKRLIGFFSALFGILSLTAAGLGIVIALSFKDAKPILIGQPDAARQQVVTMLDALCAGDYDTVGTSLYGSPNLGLDRTPEDEVSALVWEALADSFSYELKGDFYATDSGVAQNVVITCMDLKSVVENLRERSMTMLEQRVQETEDRDEVYDQFGNYREEFVMGVVMDTVRDVLENRAQTVSWEVTLNMVYENGRWWIMPDQPVLKAISGGILN